jgi:SAM-dependent methyltransferase
MNAAKRDPRAFWNQRYAAAGESHLFGTAPSQFLPAHMDWLRGARSVLCVADGEGRNSVWLAAQGLDVTATDLSPVALAKAAQHARNHGVSVRFVEADVLQGWTWPVAAYDAVVAVFVQFVGADQQGAFFAAMRAAVKPGGVLLLHGYTPEQIGYGTGGPSAAENMYTEALLVAAFADWQIKRLQAYELELDEGAGHAGRSALIDLVARKPVAV